MIEDRWINGQTDRYIDRYRKKQGERNNDLIKSEGPLCVYDEDMNQMLGEKKMRK